MKSPKLLLFAMLLCGLLLSTELVCKAQDTPTVPLYRLLYMEYTGKTAFSDSIQQNQHFYTANKAERDGAIKNYNQTKDGGMFGPGGNSGFKDEGISGYILPKQLAGTVPLYRLYKGIHRHFYTTSASEKDNAAKNLGWQSEGVVGYVIKSQTPDVTPLYRLYRPEKGNLREDHFYTISEEEKFTAIQKHGYKDGGIECYVWKKQQTVIPEKILTGNNPASDQKFNNDSRKAMISSAYVMTMGRSATETEINYWLPRKESYDQLKDACRQWLYSPEGAKDLRETVIRAYEKQNKKQPTEDTIKFIIAAARPTKAIYDELVKQLKQ